MRVRGSPRNGETAMFPRAVWTRARCPVASGVSGVSAMDKTSQFRGYSACIPYKAKSHDEARIQSLKDDMDGVLIFVRSDPVHSLP